MKMKAVIAQTGLTDRAVRLYMEQGLISPSCTENYNGRKNIDFSPQDVARLQNIVLLRQAGFSIAEIRRMQQNAADTPQVLQEFIERERALIHHKDSILRALDTLPLADGTTTEDVCRCIERAVRSGEIPREDLYPLPGEQKNQQDFFRFGVFLAILGAAALAVLPIVWHSIYTKGRMDVPVLCGHRTGRLARRALRNSDLRVQRPYTYRAVHRVVQ